MANLFLIANIFSSFFLCGLIWTIQLVHYPIFHRLGKNRFTTHIEFHKKSISFIVVPLMLLELGTSFFLTFTEESYSIYHASGFIIVLCIWITTFLIQVPLHNRLSVTYSKSDISKLVGTNWIRTILWTLKAGISFELLRLLVQ